MLAGLDALPRKLGKVWGDLREPHEQRVHKMGGACLHTAAELFPPLMDLGPCDRLINHIRGLEGHLLVEREPENWA
jgi:hypothetical protein